MFLEGLSPTVIDSDIHNLKQGAALLFVCYYVYTLRVF